MSTAEYVPLILCLVFDYLVMNSFPRSKWGKRLARILCVLKGASSKLMTFLLARDL